ncbi:RBBP8 N-terminal-like protein isoform X3 [Dicentrarchus labrax]|uniref:RBBP8 N-terminal-like protein isoform X3 n=1 Tax=Dicentrarchus labrax TaxID=13489 RepID=UPI0021F59210|nr:RBBP8 N-terminal-like protein isoform X3 [Dicentrarchus labrax]
MAMECFNSLLLKLREVHEREVEGWQAKIQELSNKKGCDTKRMEELFSKNQQMKEQQRLLTENIKTLENRLRAGLCDRCTVTQEVAKRRQQEFEASQIQSIQHMSILAGEMTNLKKENKRLRDEIRNLRAALDRGHSEHSSNSSTTTGVKPNSSPDLSPSSGPMALITAATSRASNKPVDGDVAVKTEVETRAEETEHRQRRGMNRNHYDSYKPLSTLALPSWKTEPCCIGERGAQIVEGLNQQSSIPPQALLLKNASSSTGGEVNPSRHVLHAPVPCRPQPLTSGPVTLPWPLSESPDWVTAAATGSSLVVQPSPKPNLPRFPNLILTAQHGSPRRQSFGSLWHKQSTPRAPAVEPTVLFRLRSLSEHVESKTKPEEKKEILPSKPERISGEGLREVCEGPLDLSDRGKSKSSETPREYSPSVILGVERVQSSPEKDMKTNPSTHTPVSSPHCAIPPSSSSTLPVKQQEEEPTSDHNHKATIEQEKKEEVNGKTDQSNEKKVPVLTISLRPVVVLETLNSALQKQESLSSNGKSSSPVETVSSCEDQDEEESVSGQESNQSCKRKRASVETETDRESDSDNIQQGRKIKITVRNEEKSPS